MQADDCGRQLELLDGLITELTDARSEADVLAAAARYLPKLLPVERASIGLPTEDGLHLEMRELCDIRNMLPQSYVLQIEGTLTGQAYRTGQAWIRPTSTSSPLSEALLARSGFAEFANVPLLTESRVLGTLNLAATVAGTYGPDDLR